MGNSQECANILYGLATIQASWSELEDVACRGILDRVRICQNDFSDLVRIVSYMHTFLISLSTANFNF
jgi:hypothetical protein